MKDFYLLTILTLLLIFLFLYTGAVKLLDYSSYAAQMRNQVGPPLLLSLLTPLLPLTEIGAALLLLFPAVRRIGLWIALGLLTAFTLYAAIIILGLTPRVPCSCGGFLQHLSWPLHLLLTGSLSLGTAWALQRPVPLSLRPPPFIP